MSGACFVWVTAGFLGHRVGIRSFMNAWRGILARRLSRLCGFVGVSLCGFMVCGFLCVCVVLWVCAFVCGWICRLVARCAWTQFCAWHSRAKVSPVV